MFGNIPRRFLPQSVYFISNYMFIIWSKTQLFGRCWRCNKPGLIKTLSCKRSREVFQAGRGRRRVSFCAFRYPRTHYLLLQVRVDGVTRDTSGRRRGVEVRVKCDCLISRQHPDTRSRLASRASADGLKSVSCPESLWSSVGRSHNGCRRQGNYGHGGGLHGPVHSHTLHLLVPFPFRLQLWLGELLIWLFLQILWLLLRLLFNWLLRCRKRLLISSSNLLLITRLFITL